MRASSFPFQTKESPVSCATNQQDLFDHSVIGHATVETGALCPIHAEKARCIMQISQVKERKTYRQQWHEYDQAQINEKAKFLGSVDITI